jgi:hypothetical protein
VDAIPDYSAKPLINFFNYCTETLELLNLCIFGIQTSQKLQREVKLRFDTKRFLAKEEISPEEEAKELKAAEEISTLALKECKADFPLLHSHTLVGTWGALEAAIEDMLVGLLVNEPELLRNEALARIRIPLAEFESLEKDERMRLLLSSLAQDRGLGRNQGVDAFEGMLKVVGLDGKVDTGTKKQIWEMQHVRNAIVHRGAVADRRLINACPWLNLKVNDRVIVTHGSLSKYTSAVLDYISTIAKRLKRHHGVGARGREETEKVNKNAQ